MTEQLLRSTANWSLCTASALIVSLALATTKANAQDDLLPLIVELLGDSDKDVRALAFEQIRTQAPGEAATRKFAELLPTLPPETQIGMLSALAARGDAAAAPEIRALLAKKSGEPLTMAAADALGFLGNEQDVGALVDLLRSTSRPLADTARASLIRLAGEPASQAIIVKMQQAPTAERIALIEILTERRAGASELLAAAVDKDEKVRGAAMAALGRIGTPDHIEAMARAVLKAKPGSERTAAERSVAEVCRRIEDADKQAEPLLSAMKQLNAKERIALMPALGRVGGPQALATAEEAYRIDESAEHAAGLIAMCNWPDGTVAARLLELARTEDHAQHRTQARRSLIRIAPLEDARSDERRLDLLRTLMAMCDDEGEQKQILDRAKAVRTVETLRFVAPYMGDPNLSEQACLTVVELAHHSNLREPNKEEFHAALDKVIATSKDAVVVDRANRYKTGQTWVRPKPAK